MQQVALRISESELFPHVSLISSSSGGQHGMRPFSRGTELFVISKINLCTAEGVELVLNTSDPMARAAPPQRPLQDVSGPFISSFTLFSF